ncbi:type II CRISPR-associated endonuclease Cas1 [Companilactobacillus sp. HBUAS56257]|jgi:CRISPR-associated protein Cas1|uniref:type II CRISPR-associated endonuclease Cas1 n=1 Tax=Companilactobacillus sp. HBUAS56257 TaxID=3109360 RepID=UPI002FF19CE6
MGWETIYITQKAKLSYKSNHLLVQTTDSIKRIPFHHIHCVIVGTTQAVITGYLISKLVESNIKIIFCDQDHNPCSELNGYYSNVNRNQNIEDQISWTIDKKQKLWTYIIKNKIENQIDVAKKLGIDTTSLDQEYNKILDNDESNREAVIAKKYFPLLYGDGFTRTNETRVGMMLNYGYTILLSNFNQEIVSQGYLTQLGIHHHSMKNFFNLSSDLMEPFRQAIDLTVYEKRDYQFDEYVKFELITTLDKIVSFEGKDYSLKTGINKYVHASIDFLNGKREQIGKVIIKDEG